MCGRYLGEAHTFFTPDQLKKAQEKRKKQSDPAEHVQLGFSWELRGLNKAEHKQRLRNKLMKKGE